MWTFLNSIKTTALGVLVLICGGVAFTGVLADYNQLLMLVCGSLTGLGLIAAKDANISNAPNPAAPVVVTPELAAKPNPSQVK